MKEKRCDWKKLLCMVLVAVFVVQLVPSSVLAEMVESVQAPEKTEGTVIATETDEPATIQGEVEGERDESIKHYRLDDGSFVAVQYAEPVHYKTSDGQWQEIDNTLTLENDEYVSENGSVTKRFAKDLGSGRLFEVSFGEYSLSMSAVSPDGGAMPPSGEGEIGVPIAPELTSEASVENPERQSVKGLEPSSLPSPALLTSEISYIGAYNGADLVYENHGYNIKESIVVKQPQSSYTYAFGMSAKGLEAELTEAGAVELKNEAGQVIFEIPAPYMVDANGETSTDARYILAESDEGYILGLTASSDWMNDDARVYPVTIDPSVYLHYKSSNLKTVYVRQNMPTGKSPSYVEILCGRNNTQSYGACQMVVQVETLPAIPQNCVIVNAQLALKLTATTVEPDPFKITISAYELGGTVSNLENLTWNGVYGSGGVGCKDKVVDYRKITDADLQTYLSWDVTNAAAGWYAASATKGALLFQSENQYTSHGYAKFIGHGLYDPSPYFIVNYRNTVGLEDYYTYQTASIARAGTAYIGDYSNQMTVVNSIAGYSSDAVGAELSLVYNTAYAGYNFGGTDGGMNAPTLDNMKFGRGWKLSLEQTVKAATIGGEKYLIYNDADGTEHYFQSIGDGKYKDEDGLGLTITAGSGYTMTDTDKYHTWTFSSAGLLTKITDSNGNTTNINYSGGHISSVTVKPNGGDSVTVATLSYNSSGYLTSLVDHRSERTSFAYNGIGDLTSISYSDGKTASYSYNSGGYMLSATDNESGYGVTMSYRGNGHGGFTMNRICEVSGGNEGAAFHAYKNSQQLSSYRFYGPDHTPETQDDVVAYYAFDHAGRTICSYQTNHDKTKVIGSSAASYTKNSTTSDKNNRLTGAGATGLATPNVSLDGDFEHQWVKSSAGVDVSSKSYKTTGVNDTHVRTGKWSMRLTASGAGTSDSGYLRVQLAGNTQYTVSCYVNSSETSGWTDGSSYGRFSIKKPDGSFISSEKYTTKTSGAMENGWSRISYTFTTAAAGSYLVGIEAGGFSGSYYADDLQIDYGDTAGVRNHVLNGKPNGISWWGFANGASYNASTSSPFGAGVLKVVGGPEAWTSAAQDVPINEKGGTYIVSGWAKANAIGSTGTDYGSSEPYFGIIAAVYYEGSTGEEWHFVPFNKDYTDWQYASGIVIPKQSDKTVVTIKLYLMYSQNANTAYFDNISLVKEPCSSYTYDDKGNAVSAKEGGAKTNCEYESDSSILKKYTAATGVTTTFTHEAGTHNLSNIKTAGMSTSNYYNSAGQVTSTVTFSGDWNSAQESSSTYNKFGEKETYTDENYVTTKYSHNANSHNMIGTQVGTNYQQKYGYDYGGRLLSTFHENKVALHYTYTNGSLTTFARKSREGTEAFRWQSYNFTYDAFGNMTSIGVSNAAAGETASNPIILAQYEYETGVNNGRLKTMTFGNGHSVTYDYDIFDRTTGERYNSGENSVSYDYKYDSNGSLVRQSSSSGERYDYEYDSLGRLIRSEETRNGAFAQRTEHIYDAADRLTKQSWYNSGGTTTLAYTYNSSNGFISSLTYGGTADIAVNYTYNGVNQLGNKSAGGVYNKGYEYAKFSVVENRNSSKNLVSKLTYSGKLSDTWSYTYDSNGRIASESHGSTNTYGYDGQGQLTSAKVNGTQYSYTYDTAGNITGKTIGSTSYNYEYNNPKWLDQLTGYNGGSITYDNCGNPLTYYDGSSFTWTQGRRLSGYTNGSTSIEFAYNMAGVRSSKTVGSTTYNYTTLSGLVTRQTWGSNSIDFLYDENNQPFAMKYNGTWYYYVLNVQGDVVKLIKADGTAVASYTYDPWGKILTSTGDLANINPLRYRGYYYDTETGLYYLQSRYYDPEIGRFINADSYTTTDSTGILSANMYAYCENDPVMGVDPSGEWVHLAVGAIVGGITGAVSASRKGDSVLVGIITGAIGGVLAASGAGLVAQVAGSAALSAVNNAVNQLVSKPVSSFSVEEVGEEALVGAASGLIGGKGASYGNSKSIMKSGFKLVKQLKRNLKHGKSLFKPIRNYYRQAHGKGKTFVLWSLGEAYAKISLFDYHMG